MDFKQVLRSLIASVIAVVVASKTASGIYYDDITSLTVAVVLLSVFNTFLKPLLMFFSLPFIVFTFGLGIWIINALLFLLVAAMVNGFYVESFLSALWGAFILSVINFIGSIYFGDFQKNRATVRFSRGVRVTHSNVSENSDNVSRQPRSFIKKDDDVIDI